MTRQPAGGRDGDASRRPGGLVLPLASAAALLVAIAAVVALAVVQAPPDPRLADAVPLPLPPPPVPEPVRTGPALSLIVSGLGMSTGDTRAAMQLPLEVGLAFSPYGPETPALIAAVQGEGRDSFIELPLAAADPAVVDQGPLALAPGADPAENLARLERVLAVAGTPAGVVAAAGSYAARPEAFAGVAAELAARGLVLVELGGAALAEPALAAGLRWRTARGPLESDLSPARIDAALAALAGAAQQAGSALGYITAYPLTLRHVGQWLDQLDQAGLALLPPTEALQRPADGGARGS